MESKEDELAVVIEFARKIARVMDDLRSSHVFFIISQAYGDIEWEEAQEKLNEVVRITQQCQPPNYTGSEQG